MEDLRLRKIKELRLGRHIEHDPRSWSFRAPNIGLGIPKKDVSHIRYGDVIDQGSLGMCTGAASAHCLNCSPIRLLRKPRPTLGYHEALDIYKYATALDSFPGSYPPEDTGSSGVGVCKAMQKLGYIHNYEWAFGFNHALSVIQIAPMIVGTYWYDSMFYPSQTGQVIPGRDNAQSVGGHEYCFLGVEIRSSVNLKDNRAWFVNSWGLSWGRKGYFFMTWGDFEMLVSDSGDLARPIY